MTVVELRPNIVGVLGAGWSAVGAADTVAALADELNPSYAESVSGTTSTWGFSTAGLAINQRVAAMRLRIGLLGFDVTGVGAPGFNVTSAGSASAGPSVLVLSPGACTPPTRGGGTSPRTADCYDGVTPAIIYSNWWARSANNTEFTQAELDVMQVSISSLVGSVVGDFQYASLALELDVRTQPSVVVNQSIAASSVAPVLSWTSVPNDGDIQSAWEIAVFSVAQSQVPGFNPATSAATYRAAGAGLSTSGIVAASLVVGDLYFAYVRIAKKLGYDTNDQGFSPVGRIVDWYSQWAFNTIFISPVDTATYVPKIPLEGVMGCRDWMATVSSRGGGSVIELPWQQISWGRRLQDVSQATVTFPRSACTSVPFLVDIHAWEHEIGIWRDSEVGPIQEWVGPLVGQSSDRDSITLRARDWFTIFEHRQLHADYNLAGIELATIFAAFALDALSVDWSSGLALAVRSTTLMGSRTVLASEHRRSADMLRDLGRSGVDWTVIGRTLLAGGVELPLAACRLLIDEHVEKVDYNQSGESTATSVTVVGRSTGGVAVSGMADTASDTRGILETVVSASDVADSESADVYASSVLALLSEGPEEWKVTLSEHTQNGFGRLVPGAHWPVDLPSVGLRTHLRLHQLDVSVSRTPDGATTQQVEVLLTALGPQGAS